MFISSLLLLACTSDPAAFEGASWYIGGFVTVGAFTTAGDVFQLPDCDP